MEEEVKHVVHGESSGGSDTIRVSRVRIWQLLSFVFLVLFLVSIFSGFKVGGSSVLSADEAGKKTADYINENLLQGQATASVTEVKESNGLYLMKLDINGQALEVYATKDGAVMFPQAINMDEVPEEEAAPEEAPSAASLEVGNAPVKGNDDAPVTIIEFSDFSCPFCGAAAGKNKDAVDYMKSRDSSWEAPVPGIMKSYVDSGKAKVVFKYFPGHGTGGNAMKLAWCSDEQGKFWEVHDVFFDNQASIEDVEKLKELASGVGVDRAKLEECYKSGKYDSRLASDANEGKAAGVSGTPTFFVNGVKVSGAQSFSAMSKVIEAELKG